MLLLPCGVEVGVGRSLQRQSVVVVVEESRIVIFR